jgi:WD40 repeat protein
VVKVWRLATAGETHMLADQPLHVYDFTFQSDGRLAATASLDANLKACLTVWDPDARREVLVIRTQEKFIGQVAFSPDGTLLAAATPDDTVGIWSATDGRERLRLRGHTGPVSCVCFSPDSRRLASARGDVSGKVRTGLEVKVWDMTTGKELVAMQGQADEMIGLTWTSDAKRLVARGLQRTLRIWDATSGEVIASRGFPERPFYSVPSLAVSPDGRFVAYPDGRWVQVWDRDADTVFTLHGHTESVAAVAFTPDGHRLVSVDNQWTVRLWDVGARQHVLAFRPPHRGMRTAHRLAIREDGLLAVAGYGGDVRLWDGRDSAGTSTAGHLQLGHK